MNFLFSIFNKIEYLLSILQGKGFGAYKISLNIEAKKALSFFDNSKKLVVFDIGGNIGEYTEKILDLNYNSKITIFEPSKKNSKLLFRKFEKLENVKVQNFGFNSKSGNYKLYHDKPGSPLASLSKRSFLGSKIKFKGYEIVKFTTLKNYIKKNKLKKIDLMKLDVEGYELNCLVGAGKFIKKISVIQFEFGGCNIDTKTYFKDFWSFFNKNSFDLYVITPFYLYKISEYSEKYENFLTTNFLAINKKFKNKK